MTGDVVGPTNEAPASSGDLIVTSPNAASPKSPPLSLLPTSLSLNHAGGDVDSSRYVNIAGYPAALRYKDSFARGLRIRNDFRIRFARQK